MQAVTPEHNIFGNPSIKGNLDQVHPAKLLYGFFKAKKTGALKFNDDANDIWLYLAKGCLVAYERGVFAQDDFAWHLVRFGLIAEKEYTIMRRKAERKKTSPVQMLIDDGVLDRATVQRLAVGFYERSLIGLFSWRRATYLFYERPELEGYAGDPEPLRTLRWILDGVRRKYHQGWIEKRLEQRMEAPLKVFAEAPATLDQLLVSEPERLIAEQIRQGATPAQIIRQSTLTPAEVRALLYGLATIECIKFEAKDKAKKKKKPAPAAPQRPVDPLENLFREAEASLSRIHLETTLEKVVNADSGDEAGFADAAAIAQLSSALASGSEGLTPQLKQKILDRIRDLQSTPTPPGEPALVAEAVATNPPVGSPEDLAELARILDPAPPPETAPADESPEEMAPPAPTDDFGMRDAPDSANLPDFGSLDLDQAAAKAGLVESGDKPADENPDLFAVSSGDMALQDEDPPDQLFKMGAALLEQEQWEQGYRAIARAVERGYASADAKVQLGWALFHAFPDDSDRFAKAAEFVQQGIDLEPRNAVGYLAMGKLYLAAGDKHMAELYLVKAVELDRDCRPAKELIRKIYQEK
jgi:tetratricopeptide (TPR) repeat protein